jgi:hypothetical protein
MKKGLIPLFAPGALLIILLTIIALIIIGPMLLITFSKELMILFQLAASIVILSWVKNTVGPGLLAYAISAILIYIFVFILPQFTMGIWVLYTFMGLGMWTLLFWGLTMFGKIG